METVKTAIRRTLAGRRKTFGRTLSNDRRRSLSDYFTAGSVYFYGYPAGTDSDFLLRVPPVTEELVAARALSCAGPEVSVVTFAATQPPILDQRLANDFGLPGLTTKQTIILPSEITSAVKGAKRDRMIMDALKRLVPEGELIMAQPYNDESMSKSYQIRPAIIGWLNDKLNMSHYIPNELLPKRLAFFSSGRGLAEAARSLDLPCVIKVSSSSSGDGVYICRSPEDINHAVKQLNNLGVKIFVEEYIEAQRNYGLHFGIPANPDKPIDIIGANEQVTTPAGAFIGGKISSTELPNELKTAAKTLKNHILPTVRALGWHGVGCFDVIMTADGQPRFIDCNFRMTGMSAYHFLLSEEHFKSPLLGFAGKFHGNQTELKRALSNLAAVGSPNRCIQLIALNHHSGVWNFNAALTYESDFELKQKAYELLAAGIKSSALESILK